jgi:hypothetical protein
MDIKPKISLFATAYRPQYWMRLYESINSNLPFEVVFVGPNEPDYVLPDNFYYIKSNVKPAQCVEIAARNTVGELIMQVADDIIFTTSNPLNLLYDTYDTYSMRITKDKLMLSCKYMLMGNDVSVNTHHYFYGDLASPLMPVGMLLSSKLYMKLGGIDSNFIAIHGEMDLTMRLYESGGTLILSEVYINEPRDPGYTGGLCDEYQKLDKSYLDSLWLDVEGKTLIDRSRPLEPFLDYKILEESQGPKGRWV